MLTITPQMTIYVCLEVTDFRKGIDSLQALCRDRLRKDAQSGALFVFRNRKKTTLKILTYDGSSYWLCIRRLSHGKVRWWPNQEGIICELESKQLQVMLLGGNADRADFRDDWKKLIRN